MILDTSAVIAVLFSESNAQKVLTAIQDHVGALTVSVVTVAEMHIVAVQKSGELDARQVVDEFLTSARVQIEPVTASQLQRVSEGRYRYNINFGDCFVYALARDMDQSILTCDRDFRRVDAEIVLV